ncbi:FAD-binding oxidoreductase [Micromonospora sp. MH99]|uniref:FAD-binding oxidoreductase n=1 Tax=Micromonospora sp. MH99 TaxID=1945510 RepID=UPI001F46E06F|nr:FAD-dependent oxidoreductase [Micromonospora sp. MH99]
MSSAATPDVASAAARLRALLGDRLHEPGEPGFDTATRLWNAAVDSQPALVAHCLDADEVAAAVRVAARCHLPVSVRSGGHDWAGRALRDGGLVLDLTGLHAVRVDPDSCTVTVAGGASAADLLAAAAPYDLVVPTGVVRDVGMAGLTLAGGYGPLCGRFGLALDNLLGAEVVLADGRRVTADPRHDAELYWALRGGGGNVGVVTELRYRAHRLPAVLAGMIMFALAEAPAVLRGYAALLADAPDELTVMAGFLPGPAGEPVVSCARSTAARTWTPAARGWTGCGRWAPRWSTRSTRCRTRTRCACSTAEWSTVTTTCCVPAGCQRSPTARWTRWSTPPGRSPRRSPRWPCTTSTARPPGSGSATRRSACAPSTC